MSHGTTARWLRSRARPIMKSFAEAADNEKALRPKKSAMLRPAKSKAAKTIDAVYLAPFLAHATMEPMNFTADVRADSAEVWGGIQAQMVGSGNWSRKTAGVPVEKVKVNTTLLGGGFGRRFEMDYVIDAVLLSKAVGNLSRSSGPARTICRTIFIVRAHTTKCPPASTPRGKPVFWHHRVVNDAIMARARPGVRICSQGLISSIIRRSRVHTICRTHFRIFSAIGSESIPGVPVGFWRSVGSSHTAFSTECFMDELAAAAGKDPLDFRLSMLDPTSRHAGVLKLAAEKAGWTTNRPKPDRPRHCGSREFWQLCRSGR